MAGPAGANTGDGLLDFTHATFSILAEGGASAGKAPEAEGLVALLAAKDSAEVDDDKLPPTSSSCNTKPVPKEPSVR